MRGGVNNSIGSLFLSDEFAVEVHLLWALRDCKRLIEW